jgi:hypothetical protein
VTDYVKSVTLEKADRIWKAAGIKARSIFARGMTYIYKAGHFTYAKPPSATYSIAEVRDKVVVPYLYQMMKTVAVGRKWIEDSDEPVYWILPEPPWYSNPKPPTDWRDSRMRWLRAWFNARFWWGVADGPILPRQIINKVPPGRGYPAIGYYQFAGRIWMPGILAPFLWEKHTCEYRKSILDPNNGPGLSVCQSASTGNLTVKYIGRGNAPSYLDPPWVIRFPYPKLDKRGDRLVVLHIPTNAELAAWVDAYNANHREADRILMTIKNVDGRRVVTVWGPIRIKETEPGTFATLASKAGMVAPLAVLIPGAGVAVAVALKAISTAAAVESVQTAREAEDNLRSLEDSLRAAAKAGSELSIQEEAALNAWAASNLDLLAKAGTTPDEFNSMTFEDRAQVLSKITMIREEEARRARTQKIVGWGVGGAAAVGVFGFVIWKLARR